MKKIKLTQGKYALVDNEDFKYLNKFKWCYVKNRVGGYAARRNPKKIGNYHGLIFMHRIINNTLFGFKTDHIDGNKLNNQKKNLRNATELQNRRNRIKYINNKSGYKGVYWNNDCKKWAVQIKINRKPIHLGVFISKKKAAIIYNIAAIKYFGNFAFLNKI